MSSSANRWRFRKWTCPLPAPARLVKTEACGPLCSEAALLTLLDQVKRSVAAGAQVLLGGGRLIRTGAFIQPSILTDIKKGTRAYLEEFFGPVALFFRVANEDEAVAFANDSKFGLGGSVFTADLERGKRVASRIETGMVFVNHPPGQRRNCHFAASNTPAMDGSSPVLA